MARRKSSSEARVERFTWFLLVLTFAALNIVPEDVPNPVIPIVGSIIILGSAIYQYSRKWHVSPIMWVFGSLLLALGIANIYILPSVDLIGIVLIFFALTILFGVVTNES